MTQEIKDRLEHAALAAAKSVEQRDKPISTAIERSHVAKWFKDGAQTILENPSEWGLQEIPDYYCTEKDRIGYVCEDGPCDRCELLIQQDAVATRNELLVESEKEIFT